MSHIALAEEMSEGQTTRPAALLEGRQAEPPIAAGPVRPTGVLVIEDEKLMRNALEQGMTKRGFVIWAAADGGEGVELYRRLGDRIDVVLSDVNMPVMDGPQTLDALRGINPRVRCCFMTADVRSSTLDKLLKVGALRVFTKPFPSVAKVAEELRELAARPPVAFAHPDSARDESVADENPATTGGASASGFLGWFVSLVTRLV